MFRIELVDPRQHCDTIGEIVRGAWEPPCILYDNSYVYWQFGFPGAKPPLGMIAYEGDHPVGCNATTPRRLRMRGRTESFHLQSFLAALPGARGVGVSILRAMYAELQRHDEPIITFCQTDSVAERLTLISLKQAGYVAKRLCTLPLHGFASQMQHSGELTVEEVTDSTEFLTAGRRLQTDESTLWHDIDRLEFDHILSDSRSPTPLVVRSADGKPVAIGIALRSPIMTMGGIVTTPTLQNVCVAQQNSEALNCLCSHVLSHSMPCDAKTVMIPNAWGLDTETCRQAGVRRLQGGYACLVAATEKEHPVFEACGTDLDIV